MENDLPPADLPRTGGSIPEDAQTRAPDGASSQTRQPEQTPKQKKALARWKKKSEFLANLSRNLDTLIYVELCIIYYMDCSLFRLALRLLNQMLFLTPKPIFLPPAPQHRPYIGAIFLPNMICLLLHVFTARSEAGEAMRGYLHGGVIIDLIGQKGPTSKIHLFLLDILLLVLQCFMLAVHVEAERVIAITKAYLKPSSDQDLPRSEISAAQDHDAEERGVMRDEFMNDRDVALQLVASSGAAILISNDDEPDADRNLEREILLAEPPPRPDDDDDESLDMFWSGMAVMSEFHVLHTLRRQWDDYGSATGSALQTVGYSAEFAAITANRRLNTTAARLQRGVDALNN